MKGLLDQGYYPEGIYTPASYEAYENDVLTMKELGFNCRLIIIGEGVKRKELEIFIDKHQLNDCVTLIGYTDNPYQIMAQWTDESREYHGWAQYNICIEKK